MHAPTFHEKAWLSLIADRLLPQLVSQKHEPSPRLRIWSIGCQTGDEALLLELCLLQHQQVPTESSPFTIFATDPDAEAVVRARRLAASGHLEMWENAASYRSLLKEGWDGLSLPDAWRQSLVFAAHDLLTSVPFPRLDLTIVHLSLASYEKTQQAEILNRLAYALLPGGFLLLLGEPGSVLPDAALYQRHEASPVPFYQRTEMKVQPLALRWAHQRRYQFPATALDIHPDQERALIEEQQALLEEQEVRCEELEAQVHQSREARLAQLHLAAIVASSEDAILSKDLNGIVTSWNEGAERLYGFRAQEIIGQSVARIFPPDRKAELTQIMNQIRQGERVGSYETMRLRKDGSLVPVSVTISPVKESDGTIVGASDIARDMTPRYELDQQRETFVNLVTHELKNPLTALFGNIQLAQRWLTRVLARPEHLDNEQQRALEEVLTMLGRSHQQMRVQRRLIDDLLDLSHMQQGTLELHQEPCDLLAVVYETVQNYQAAYSTRLIELTLLDQDNVWVSGDRDRLEQVLSNYLSNALKFAPVEQPVRVGMSLQGESVRVWVQDEGPGLTREQQVRIWERYVKVSRTPVQEGWKAGLGLGLYICRQLIQRMSGEVGVESTPGQGATFWFSLPVARSQESMQARPLHQRACTSKKSARKDDHS